MKVSLRYVNLTEQVLSSFSKATGKEVGEYSLYCSKYQDVSNRDSGMRRMITTGMNVIVSLNVRLGEEKRNTAD